MTRRDFLRGTTLAAAGGCMGLPQWGWAQEGTEGKRPPNIIVILADDLGYGDLGCYGNKEVRTPHIDQLAREGMRFTDFHSSGPMCSPTRAALLTGRYQNRMNIEFALPLMGNPDAQRGLPRDEVTIAQRLRERGYKTAMYGKWHLGHRPDENPIHFGFDDFRGLVCGCGDYAAQINRQGLADWWHNESLAPEEGNTTKLITEHSLRFIEENKEQPFFLYVAHLSIHFPWMRPDDPPHRKLGEDFTGQNDPANSKLGPHVGGDDMQSVVHSMISDLDSSTGQIMETLKRNGLDENTIVVFSSDNGGYINYDGMHDGEISSNGPLRGQKAQLWEGGHRVPSIVRWPGRVPVAEVGETVATMDLMPTFLEFAGIQPGEGAGKPLDGISIAGLLTAQEPLPERTIFWRMRTESAARKGQWKLMREGEAAPQLFDLVNDIGETKDVATEHPEIVAELAEALARWEREMDADRAEVLARNQ